MRNANIDGTQKVDRWCCGLPFWYRIFSSIINLSNWGNENIKKKMKKKMKMAATTELCSQ